MKVWVLKTAVIDNSHSGRLKSWAGKFNMWVPGNLRRNHRMERDGITGYGVTFIPEPGFSGVRVNVPGWTINVDKDLATRLIRGGMPLATFDSISANGQTVTPAYTELAED